MYTIEIKILKRLLNIFVGAAFFVALVPAAQSAQNWQTLITATADNTAKNKLTIGQNAKATDGMDNFYDITGMLSGDIVAYLQSPKGGLWQEIKGTGSNKTWTMKISSTLTGKLVKVSLDRSRVPAGVTIYLNDNNSGHTTNLTQKGDYSYTNNGERTFTIESINTSYDAGLEETPDETNVGVNTAETQETTTGDIIYKSKNTNQRGEETNHREKSSRGFKPNYSRSKSHSVAKEYESYYKPSTKKLAEQVAGKLKQPSNIRGWIKKKQGLYLEWDDKSKGEHGFIVEKKCGNKKNWSLLAALWGVRPTYTNKKATIKSGGSCQYRVIAFNHITESNYSDIVTFSTLGEIEVIERKAPVAPAKKKLTTKTKTKKFKKRKSRH